MATITGTLTDFLLARIAEDEANARAAIDTGRPGERWAWEAPDGEGDPTASRWLRTVEEFPTTSGVGPLPAFPLGHDVLVERTPAMAHIARHDPARVLAECEAKRSLVRFFADGVTAGFESWDLGVDARFTLGTLALPYADHPDYREEWRPVVA